MDSRNPSGAVPPYAETEPHPAEFPWLDFLVTDNETIDREHREAVEQGNQLLRILAARENWADALEMLRRARARSARHFATEDGILEQTGFLGRDQHRQAHAHILAEFDRVLAELETVADPQAHHWERAHRPRNLLVDHCLKDDLLFKSHLMHFGGARP